MQELAIRAVPVQVRCEFDDYQVVVYETESGEELTAVGSLLCTEGNVSCMGHIPNIRNMESSFRLHFAKKYYRRHRKA